MSSTPQLARLALPDAGAAIDLLDPDEQQRLATMGHALRRREFLFGRWLARQLLADALACQPAAISFRLSRHGRPDPELAGAASPWRCSISHHRGRVAVAVAPGPVGLDIEGVDRPLPGSGVQRRVLAAAERATLAALPNEQQQGQFFAWWCLKEAVVKRDGTGVGRRMQATRPGTGGSWPRPIEVADGQRHAWLQGSDELLFALVCDSAADLSRARVQWLDARTAALPAQQ